MVEPGFGKQIAIERIIFIGAIKKGHLKMPFNFFNNTVLISGVWQGASPYQT